MIQFTIKTEPEDQTPEQAEKTLGFIEGFADSVHNNLDHSKKWGWCNITVTAFDGERVGKANLGGCSYKSLEDFIQYGYFTDLCKDALRDMD